MFSIKHEEKAAHYNVFFYNYIKQLRQSSYAECVLFHHHNKNSEIERTNGDIVTMKKSINSTYKALCREV